MGVVSWFHTMQVSVCMLVVLVSLGQAAPVDYLVNTPEVRQAKAEFLQALESGLSGLLSEVAPTAVQDTLEVREAKEEFFRIFDKALNGIIETVFLGDSQDVKEYKEKFFKTYNSAMTDLFVTVDGIYTPEQVTARKNFHQAYKDAQNGIIGAQYIEDTQEVKDAKARFFKFFQFVLDGMLYKLAPIPGHNVIPKEIEDFYIKDDPEVAAEKLKFDQLYRSVLHGDAASVIVGVALQNAISNNPGDSSAAVKDLDDTLNAIVDAVDDEYSDTNDEEDDGDGQDSDVIDNEAPPDLAPIGPNDDEDDDDINRDNEDVDSQDGDYDLDDYDDDSSEEIDLTNEEEDLLGEEEEEDADSSLLDEENTEDSDDYDLYDDYEDF